MRRRLTVVLLWGFLALNAFAEDKPLDRIAFGSCNRDYKPQPLWKPICDSKPDLWIWLGDIVYGRADRLAELAGKYRNEKEKPGYKALRAQCRIIGVWDDNDYGVSDGGSENPNKVESQKLLLDFLDEPADSPRRKQEGVYASYVFGPAGRRVKIILLDGRYFRQEPGKKSDMLGAQQWQWLERELTGSDADVNIIGSGIQVIATEQRFEKWAEFPQSRQRLFDLVARSQARNVIFISGDRHLGEISRITLPGMTEPVYDITSSGMTHHATNNIFYSFEREPNQYRVGGHNFVDLNFGLIEFAWDADPPTATFQIRDAAGAVRIEEKMKLTSGGR